MQSTGQTITQTGQPAHSSGTITTSSPRLNIAPNSGGQLRWHVSHVMHSDASMRRGGFFQFSLRDRCAIRSARPSLATERVSFAHGMSRVHLSFPMCPGPRRGGPGGLQGSSAGAVEDLAQDAVPQPHPRLEREVDGLLALLPLAVV